MQWLDRHGIPKPTTWDTIRKGRTPQVPTREQLRSRYEAGESLKAISEDYEVSWQTIRELAYRYGIELRPTGWYVGPPIECNDGHIVRSMYEKRVDNWLNDHKLPHDIEPPTPFDSRWRADFKVGDTYIEVWGVRDQPTYEVRKQAKIAAYRKHGVHLIELPYWIFDSKSRRAFERRLAPLLVPA